MVRQIFDIIFILPIRLFGADARGEKRTLEIKEMSNYQREK